MTDEVRNGEEADFTTLLEFLAATPSKVANFAAGLSNTELRFQSSLDEFSMLENICHLRDLELQGYASRIRRIIEESAPALADFDGAHVAAESSYNSQQLDPALLAFQTARQENVEALRSATEGQLEREGSLAGVGKITLKRLAELMREHDEGHLEDLRVLSQRLELARRK